MTVPYEIVVEDTSVLPRPDWLLERRKGIGSSDAAAAIGLSPWVSTYSLYADKLGLVPDRDDTETFWWGRALEPLIIGRWAEQYGYVVRSRHQMLRSIEYPFMLANPDAIAYDLDQHKHVIVECKTADSWDERDWDEGVKDHYALQCMHLMAVAGLDCAIVPVLFGGHRLREFVIDRDDALIADLIKAEAELWRRVVENDPPDVDGSEATMLAIRQQCREIERGEEVELSPDDVINIATYRQYSELAESAESTAQAAKQRLMLALGSAEYGTVNGEAVITWKADKNGRRSFRFPKSSMTLEVA